MARMVTFMMTLAMLAVSAGVAGPVQAASAAAKLVLTPTHGQVGAMVLAKGSGFAKSEMVTLEWDTSAQLVQVKAGKTGTFSTTFAVPTTAAIGKHTVTATGKKSKRKAKATFTVTAPVVLPGWITMPSMPIPRSNPAVVALPDGRIFAMGGCCDLSNDAYKVVEIYTAATNTWTKGPPLPQASVSQGATLGPDGLIYVIGGRTSNCISCGDIGTMQIYDPTANTWHLGKNLPGERADFVALTGLDGLIYCIGGDVGSQLAVGTVQAFDPKTDLWVTKALMPTPRFWFGGAVGSDGRLYAIGGYTGNNYTSTQTVDVYDTAAAYWTTSVSLPNPQDRQAAAEGADGRLDDIGGYDQKGSETGAVCRPTRRAPRYGSRRPACPSRSATCPRSRPRMAASSPWAARILPGRWPPWRPMAP